MVPRTKKQKQSPNHQTGENKTKQNKTPRKPTKTTTTKQPFLFIQFGKTCFNMSQSSRSNLHYHFQALLIQKAFQYSYILYITAPYLIDKKHTLNMSSQYKIFSEGPSHSSLRLFTSSFPSMIYFKIFWIKSLFFDIIYTSLVLPMEPKEIWRNCQAT